MCAWGTSVDGPPTWNWLIMVYVTLIAQSACGVQPTGKPTQIGMFFPNNSLLYRGNSTISRFSRFAYDMLFNFKEIYLLVRNWLFFISETTTNHICSKQCYVMGSGLSKSPSVAVVPLNHHPGGVVGFFILTGQLSSAVVLTTALLTVVFIICLVVGPRLEWPSERL